MNINQSIKDLIHYGIQSGLVDREDETYTINRILEVLHLDEYIPADQEESTELEAILASLLDYAVEQKLIDDNIVSRDLFDTKLMGCLVKRPGEIISEFKVRYERDPKLATDYYYKLSRDSDYIRRYRVKKDLKWVSSTPYGDLDITINLSKPEKDPKAIAAALKAKQSDYPKCLLCKENEGYAGRANHPARQNHRIIPITINDSPWFLQYSPYVYYNEHCIVFNAQHTPMKIDRAAFKKLLDFVALFPHYFIGSNADLPIVGGSILTHDHFQGGCYEFPMAKAPVETAFNITGFEDVQAGIVKWPMSVIRIQSEKRERLIELADHILESWRRYSDAGAMIYAETDNIPHNTITPIARFRDGQYELDLVLRNNLTTKEHPDGLYHPHQEHHHIKKENIGLIEVMGLAVLPARLKDEIEMMRTFLLGDKQICGDLEKHAVWLNTLKEKYPVINEDNADEIIRDEIGLVYMEILAQAGVYKRDKKGQDAFERFISQI